MEGHAAEEIAGSTVTYAGLALVVLVLAGLAVLRWREPGDRTVVVRRSRVVRVPRRRLLVVVPALERARSWPPDLLDLPLQVRATTRDGAEVRVLVELVVWVPPPRVGESYVDPRPAIDEAARGRVAEAVGSRTVTGLVEADGGLVAPLITALGGACLRGPDGEALGVVATVALHEVELLLLADKDGGGDGDR
jgi:hypothetical protein